MASKALQEQVYQELEKLSLKQLNEVLLFIEFLTARESREFIEYVNERTQQALRARKSGKKFYCLEELQNEFLES